MIGGWAVWSYHKAGFGSVDVDLIFPTDSFIEHMMKKTYLPANGFQEFKLDPVLGEPHYGKLVDGDRVIFDMISAETPREDSTGMGVRVDWNWVYESEQCMPIGNGAFINVPELEFLIALKIIGCISRDRKLMHAVDPNYYRSKIWKDCYDVGNLTSHLDPDKGKIHSYFAKTGLGKSLLQEFLVICGEQSDAFVEGESGIEGVEGLLALFKK